MLDIFRAMGPNYILSIVDVGFSPPKDSQELLLSNIFWRRCRGEEALLQGESLASKLFILSLFCLFYFLLLCYIKNTKKLVVAFIPVA